jgi:hypothetical protein
VSDLNTDYPSDRDHGTLHAGERETETVERIEVSPAHMPWKERASTHARQDGSIPLATSLPGEEEMFTRSV